MSKKIRTFAANLGRRGGTTMTLFEKTYRKDQSGDKAEMKRDQSGDREEMKNNQSGDKAEMRKNQSRYDGKTEPDKKEGIHDVQMPFALPLGLEPRTP